MAFNTREASLSCGRRHDNLQHLLGDGPGVYALSHDFRHFDDLFSLFRISESEG